MKFVAFVIALLGGVPLLAALGLGSEKRRGYLLAAIGLSAVMGDSVGINFFSTESYRGPDRGFEITLTDLLALGLAGALIGSRAKRLQFVPPNTLPMALFYVFGIISLFDASSPELGFFTLFKGLRLYLLYWTVFNAIRAGVDVAWLRRGLVAAALWMTALAVKQKYIEGLYRIHGTLDHSNGVPLYSDLVIPFLLLSAVSDRSLNRKEAILTLLAALGLVFSVVTTQSRAGTILAGGLVLVTLLVARWKAPSSRVNRVSVAVLLLMAVGGAMAADTIIRRFQEAPESSEAAREEFNAAAIEMAHDHATGVGLNNFSRALTEVDRYHAHLVVMKSEEQGGVAHHIYLLTAAEMGYPALGVFILILSVFALVPLVSGLRRTGFAGGRQIAIAVGMAALHLQGFLEWGFRVTPIAYQFFIVAAIGMAFATERPESKSRSRVSAAAK